MAPIARRTSALAGAAAASALAAQTFVLAPGGGAVVPRAAGSAASPASSRPATPGFGGATALAALGAAGVFMAAGRRAVRMSAAKEEVPPPPFDPSKQVGALAPLGFFDPLGSLAPMMTTAMCMPGVILWTSARRCTSGHEVATNARNANETTLKQPEDESATSDEEGDAEEHAVSDKGHGDYTYEEEKEFVEDAKKEKHGEREEEETL